MREITNYMISIKILKTLKEDTKRKAFIERNKAEHILKKGNTLETRRHIPSVADPDPKDPNHFAVSGSGSVSETYF